MKSKSTTKISFLGDITCDRPLLKASRVASNKYDFSDVFSEISKLLEDSDYSIANFETVCAGSDNDFKNEFFLYNCPDQMISDMKDAGIDFVTTANNHSLDQGIEGMISTIKKLDYYGVKHTGTFIFPEDRNVDHNVIYINGLRIAVLAYTYGTNESNTGLVLDSHNDFHIGLLRKQVDNAKNSKGIKGFLARNITPKQRRQLQRLINGTKVKLGLSYFKPFSDSISIEDSQENEYLKKVKKEIQEAKKVADYVIVCPHIGGQFNVTPGSYCNFIIAYLKQCGADVIVGNHPHVAQKAITDRGFAAAYSLGSFNLSPSSDYIIHESLPQYSIVLHMYIDNNKKMIDHFSFSILKIIERESHKLTVYPISQIPGNLLKEMDEQEITEIFNRVTNSNEIKIPIRSEYELC